MKLFLVRHQFEVRLLFLDLPEPYGSSHFQPVNSWLVDHSKWLEFCETVQFTPQLFYLYHPVLGVKISHPVQTILLGTSHFNGSASSFFLRSARRELQQMDPQLVLPNHWNSWIVSCAPDGERANRVMQVTRIFGDEVFNFNGWNLETSEMVRNSRSCICVYCVCKELYTVYTSSIFLHKPFSEMFGPLAVRSPNFRSHLQHIELPGDARCGLRPEAARLSISDGLPSRQRRTEADLPVDERPVSRCQTR